MYSHPLWVIIFFSHAWQVFTPVLSSQHPLRLLWFEILPAIYVLHISSPSTSSLVIMLTWILVHSYHTCFICRYKKLLSCVDLTRDFFYSYTYPIMQSLQKNVISISEERMPYENIFVWNAFLTEPIRSRCNNTIWTLALVHGNFKQVLTYQLVSLVDVFLLHIYTAYSNFCLTIYDVYGTSFSWPMYETNWGV